MTGIVKYQKQLWKIIQKDNLDKLQKFLEDVTDGSKLVTMRHKASGDSVIHLSCRHGLLELVKYFHETWNVAVNLKNLDGKTPLHEASANGQYDVAKYLLDNKVPVDSLKISDWTPLMLACTKTGNLKVVRLLISKEADIHLVNKDGWNCFHIACRQGDVAVVNYLLDLDPDIWKIVSNNGRTPLHSAAMHGKTEVFDILLQRCDFGLDTQDSCGSTPLMEAVKGGHINLTKTLVKNGASVNIVDNLGRNVLHLAAECNRIDAIKFLIEECNMDPNARTKINSSCGGLSGHSVLDWARKENQQDAINILIFLGAVD